MIYRASKQVKLFVIVIAVFAALILPCCAEAITYPISKTELVNVAQNKPIQSNKPNQHTIDGYEVSNLVDGDRATVTLSEFGAEQAGEEYFTIDLQRRCKVQKIEVFDCCSVNVSTGRENFEITGANSADFSDAVTLTSMGSADEALFPHKGMFASNIAGGGAYRYIRFKNTAPGDYRLAEIKVWADLTVTDVTRGLAADRIITDALNDDSHWIYEPMPPTAAFDGDTSTLWLEDGNAYRFMRVDLGKPYHIGMIEMSARDFTVDNIIDDFWARSYINIYGHNNDATDNSLFNASVGPEDSSLADAGFKKLVKIGSMQNPIDGQLTFPAVYVPEGTESTNGYPGKFSQTVDDTEAFRYFTYKKTVATGAALSEFSFYEINPDLNSAVVSDGKLILNFSDEMEKESIDAESVYLKDAKSKKVEASVNYIDDYTFYIDISDLNKDVSYTLFIENTVKNKKNVLMGRTVERKLTTLSELSVGSVNLYESSDGTGDVINSFHNIKSFSVKTQVSNFSGNDKKISLYAALYNKSDEETELAKVLSVSENVQVGTTKDLILPFSDDSISTDSILKIFVWEKESLMPLMDVIEYSGKLTKVYVSANDGDDSGAGTLNHPFKTIERAQREVREFNSSMDEDIVVYLRGGVYTLNDTLSFNEADSGKNGYSIKYMAYNNEDVTISGGSKINGFSDPDGDGIYTAAVEDDDITSIRDLYVNGRKAVRAVSEKKIKPVSIYEVNGKKLGYYVKSSDIGTFANPEDMQLHYSRGWASVTINVKSLVDAGNGLTLVLMDEIPFELMTTFEPYEGSTSPVEGKTYHIFWLTEQNKFYAENALELLDNGGEFYFDKKAKMLYYKPLTDENVESLEVYAPRLETLLKIKGKDLANKAENIVFEGITFAHATAEKFDNGFLGDQAQTQLVVNAPNSAYAPDNIIVGANIAVSAADGVVFRNNVFKGLGKVGIGLYEGAENVLIDKNAFCDIGDSAVTIGTPQDAYMEDLSKGKNVAYNKNVTSTVNEIGNFAAYANDGDKLRGWNIYDERTYKPGVTNYKNEYWQVDLDKPYKIDKIILKQREIVTERTDFEVLGSNSSDFSNYTVLYSIGDENDEKYTTSGDITADVVDNVKYRYVRVRKTKNSYFYMPEIEIISFDESVPSKEVCKNNTVSNNYITRIGEYNWGAPGIQAYYTDSTEISSNYIYDIPYSGICFGWGWVNTPDSVTSRNMVVKNNKIEKYAQRSYDAGGIYTLGQEPGSMIYGNYIKDQVNAYAAYYPDSGSGNSYVYNNVFENIDIAYHIHSATQHDLRIENNYSTNGFYYDRGTDCSVEAPTVFTVANIPDEAQNIINSAGLTGENALIVSKVPTRHKELSFDDIYGNAIEEDNPNILSMPTMEVLIPAYLSRKVAEAENAIAITEGASIESVNLLQTAIDEAKAVEKLGRTADRTEVIEQRVKLIKAIKTFCEANKKS